MLKLGRFRRSSAASGHASNTRSGLDRFEEPVPRPQPAEAQKGRTGCRGIFPTCRPAHINPTLSTSSIYLALLFHGLSVCAYTRIFCRGRARDGTGGKREKEELGAAAGNVSGVAETGARYKRHQKMAGGFDPAKNPASASAPSLSLPNPAPSGRLICRLRLTVEPVSAAKSARRYSRERGGSKINNPSATIAGKNIAD